MTLLMLSAERLIIVAAVILDFDWSDNNLTFDIHFLSSLIFYSAENGFQPRTFVVNMLTLSYHLNILFLFAQI